MRIQSIARAAALLREFTLETPLMGVAELSERLGYQRSTVQRLVSSLADAGLLEQDPISNKYRLGLALLELSGTMLKSRALPELVRPYLGYLTERVGESSYLGVLDRGSILEIEEIASAHMIQHSGWIGRRLPLHCTSSGKAVLASMPAEELDEFLAAAELQPYTSSTITDPDRLREELSMAAERGYATDLEEYEKGTNAVAVGLAASGNEAARVVVGVVGPSFRFTEAEIAECAEALTAVRVEISRKFARSLGEWLAT
jgi:IclR family KDG regulon transcriptional repressor